MTRRVLVLREDACIECGECIVACENRHGVSRIVLQGPRFGSSLLVDTCQQCYVPECVRVCAPGSLFKDPAGRVAFDPHTCTGCGLCAHNCPYDVIDLVHPLAPRARPMSQCGNCGAWAPKDVELCPACGWWMPERVVPKVVPNRCDQCAGFGDLACVTVCPTVALRAVDIDSPATAAETEMRRYAYHVEFDTVAERKKAKAAEREVRDAQATARAGA